MKKLIHRLRNGWKIAETKESAVIKHNGEVIASMACKSKKPKPPKK